MFKLKLDSQEAHADPFYGLKGTIATESPVFTAVEGQQWALTIAAQGMSAGLLVGGTSLRYSPISLPSDSRTTRVGKLTARQYCGATHVLNPCCDPRPPQCFGGCSTELLPHRFTVSKCFTPILQQLHSVPCISTPRSVSRLSLFGTLSESMERFACQACNMISGRPWDFPPVKQYTS